MSREADARIGRFYIDLYRAKSRLEKRRHEGQQMAGTLRLLADCLDESEPDNRITEVRGSKFKCTKTELNTRGGKSAFTDFPIEAGEIAADICELEREIESLEKDLALELKCL